MPRTTFSVRFYAREAKVSKKTGLTPLEMSLILNGKRVYLNLPYKVRPEDYQKKRKPQEIQDIENEYRSKVNDIIYSLMREGLPVTANTIREYLRTGGIKSKEIKDLFEEYLSILNPRIGISLKESVYRKYELARDLCYEILGEHKEICTISNGDMTALYDELKRRYKQSTAAGYFTKIKTIIVYAFDNGYIKKNPTNGIRIDKGHPKIEYLTEKELEKIENTNLYGNQRLEKVRDILLFQAYGGGMAYCDMANFNPENLNDVGGIYIYKGRRIKTGIEFTTPFLPKAMEILSKYGGDIKNIMMSNQKLNIYAKEIQTLSRINKNLTTHLMRKTFATMLLSKHVPISTISRAMGHSNCIITQKIYAHTQDETLAEEINKAFMA